MRTVAVIQARTGSTRLPRKVLTEIEGSTVLELVVARAAAAHCVDEVVVATTTSSMDDEVADVALRAGAAVVRGSEADVLSRFVTAAREHGAEIVVRLTADCPLVDARLIDRVVGRLVRENADYASNVVPPSYPDGYDVEAMTVDCLFRIEKLAFADLHREHVTAMARETPDEFRHANVVARRDLSAIRLTMDYADDVERIKVIYQEMRPRKTFGLGATLSVLRKNPELATDGGHVRDERYIEGLQRFRSTSGD